MRITTIRTYHVSKELRKPLKNSSYSMKYMEHILVEVDAGGYTGIGFVYSTDNIQAKALKVLVDGFAQELTGKDTELIRQHWNNAQMRINGIGQTGMPVIAWAAFDMALWDLLAKQSGLPLYKLLGAQSNEVTVYASGGWLIPLEELVCEAQEYKDAGYRQYKMKVGCPDAVEDLRRIEKVKAVFGDSAEVMIDANQGWNVKKCVALEKELIALGVRYLEEPLHAQDYCGHATLKKMTGLSICAGESLFTLTELFELMRNDCVDIINPDLQRCGGVSEFMQVCALANAFKIPVTSHAFTEASVHLIAAAPTGVCVEYIPDWWRGIFTTEPTVVNGILKLSNKPGFGVEFDHKFIEANQL